MTLPEAENSASRAGSPVDRDRRPHQSDLGAGAGGVGHLGGHRALPDQVVEAELVPRQGPGRLVGRPERLTGRPDGLVGLLGVLDLPLVAPRLGRHVLGAVEGRRLGPGRRQGLARQRGRVGAHVGDPSVLVQALGDLHGPLGAEPELAPRLLLQGRGHERSRGRAAERLVGHRLDGEGHAGQTGGQRPGLGLGQHDHRPRRGQGSPARRSHAPRPGPRRPPRPGRR